MEIPDICGVAIRNAFGLRLALTDSNLLTNKIDKIDFFPSPISIFLC
jgi:hypothetical protein